jgi:hypothetical protein
MSNENKTSQKQGLAIGGSLMLGLGIGFFLLHYSALWFIGSIITGLGIGILISARIKD